MKKHRSELSTITEFYQPICDKSSNHSVSNPSTSNHSVSNPSTLNLSVSNPSTSNHSVLNPSTSNLSVSNPSTSNLSVSNPSTSNPSVSNLSVSNPSVSNPSVSNLSVSNPFTSSPCASNPFESNLLASNLNHPVNVPVINECKNNDPRNAPESDPLIIFPPINPSELEYVSMKCSCLVEENERLKKIITEKENEINEENHRLKKIIIEKEKEINQLKKKLSSFVEKKKEKNSKNIENLSSELNKAYETFAQKDEEIRKLNSQILLLKSSHSESSESSMLSHATQFTLEIIRNLLCNFEKLTPLQRELLSNMVSDFRVCGDLSKEFWTDIYLNISHRSFNKISENFRGPWARTVGRWTDYSDNVFDFSFDKVISYAQKLFPGIQLKNSFDDKWCQSVKKPKFPSNLMVDETASKIIVELSVHEMRLYGFSFMPRFVLVRGISEKFKVGKFFNGLSIQYDQKLKQHICGVVDVQLEEKCYKIAYAQFSTYKGFNLALSKSTNSVTIEPIDMIIGCDKKEKKDSLDRAFAESKAINRPRSTYVYSLSLSQPCENTPIKEIAAISTNNKYLQAIDHNKMTYNVMKMSNNVGIPIIQFVMDGDSRFRRQMLLMLGCVPSQSSKVVYTPQKLIEFQKKIQANEISSGWDLPLKDPSDVYHFFFTAKEMEKSSIAKKLPTNPKKPFFNDPDTKIDFHLGLRACTDVFNVSCPIIGGIPRSATQDQCHWSRKMIKTSTVCAKPLRLGNYVVMFNSFCEVYEMGPEFQLVRRDIEKNNKTEQKSAERIMSTECINGIERLEWGKGTKFFVLLTKIGFECWWKANYRPIDRISHAYYCIKVLHLWKIWVDKAKLDAKQCFITTELYKDSIIMQSSLVHLALTFKLYFPEAPFMPWKWSELPLEIYFSSIRFANGNDDEFSTFEYMKRSRKLSAQREAPSGNILDTRNQGKKSTWNYPVHVSKEKHPHLFDHNWSLSDLLQGFHECDKRITTELAELGMSDLLADEPLFQVLICLF